MQHELRLSTPDDWRARGIGGAYWENNTLYDTTSWRYKGVPGCSATVTTGCISDVGPFPGSSVQSLGAQPDTTSFYQDTLRQTKQTRVLRLGRLRPDPEGTDAHRSARVTSCSRTPYKGSVISSFGCFEARRAARRLP